MSTLLLTSAGMEVEEAILRALPKRPEKMKLAHIVTAANVEDYKGYVHNDRRLMEQAGFQIEDIDLAGKNAAELHAVLEGRDITIQAAHRARGAEIQVAPAYPARRPGAPRSGW